MEKTPITLYTRYTMSFKLTPYKGEVKFMLEDYNKYIIDKIKMHEDKAKVGLVLKRTSELMMKLLLDDGIGDIVNRKVTEFHTEQDEIRLYIENGIVKFRTLDINLYGEEADND
jgi:hypothetical protein